MTRIVKKRSHKVGLPPGTLIHIGERSTREVSVRVINYDRDRCEEKEIRGLEECFNFADSAGITWVNMEGLHDVELIRKLGECQGFHPLMLEDIVSTDQRPKLEDYDDYLFVVLKMLSSQGTGEIVTEQVSLVVGANFVISFQEGLDGDSFDPVRARIRSGKGRIRTMGADYLAYALIDAVVDGYFGVLERVGERIEELEEVVVSSPSSDTVRNIHGMKREMIISARSNGASLR